MRFVVTSSKDYVPFAEMAIASIRYHHPKGHIVHMAQAGSKTPEEADEAWYSADLDPTDMPRFLCEKMKLLSLGGDTPTAVLDADTLTCKPLDDVWDREFDLALATRLTTGWGKHPYNSGVIFCRNAKFWAGLLELMKSVPYYSTFGGDQEALAVEATSGKWRFVELPGKEWHHYEVSPRHLPDARIVHFKGARRDFMRQHFKDGKWKS